MDTFSTCEGAKSCPEFCGGVYMETVDSRSLRFASYVRIEGFVRRYTYVPFRRRCLGDVCREFL
jgi:hypothetical protein